ncbi:MAG: phage gp6-like head-tail connector protein [Muribaculaceae bacterium]|nr:phage gp6-like head-tail connector protein [Muribaculaceae bacterium]
MYITLKEAKAHLNIDDELFKEDDGYILTLIEMAEDALSGEINRSLSDCLDERTGELASSLRHAIKLLVGTAYNFRESITVQNVRSIPFYDQLIAPYRKHAIG